MKAVVFLLTITRERNVSTGSWCSAKCMPAENMQTTPAKTMNSAWVLTVLVHVQPSTAPSIWMLRCDVTDLSLSCILKRAKMSADSAKRKSKEKKPVQKSAGSLTKRFLLI